MKKKANPLKGYTYQAILFIQEILTLLMLFILFFLLFLFFVLFYPLEKDKNASSASVSTSIKVEVLTV